MHMYTHEVLSALNVNAKVCGIFCDLEKAFDAVNHSILIKKLTNYGIVRIDFGSSFISSIYKRSKEMKIINWGQVFLYTVE